MTWQHTHDDAARAVLAQILPLMPECPHWCAWSHVDLLDATDVTGRYVAHFHRSVPTVVAGEDGETAEVYLERFERVDTGGAVDPRFHTVVAVNYDGEAGFSGDAARRFAAAVLNMADKLDRLMS